MLRPCQLLLTSMIAMFIGDYTCRMLHCYFDCIKKLTMLPFSHCQVPQWIDSSLLYCLSMRYLSLHRRKASHSCQGNTSCLRCQHTGDWKYHLANPRMIQVCFQKGRQETSHLWKGCKFSIQTTCNYITGGS